MRSVVLLPLVLFATSAVCGAKRRFSAGSSLLKKNSPVSGGAMLTPREAFGFVTLPDGE